MKKQILSIAVAALLAMGAFGLAACNGSGSGSAASGSASSKAPEKTPEERILGEWTVTAAEMQGVTIAGDMSALGVLPDQLSLEINDDETFVMDVDSREQEGTWELDGDDTILLTAEEETIEFKYNEDDGTIVLDMSAAGSQYEGLTVIFTNDDSTFEAPVFDLDKAAEVEDISDFAGEWSLMGVATDGFSASGNVSALAGVDISVTIEKDGSVTMSNGSENIDVTATSKGGSTVLEANGAKLPVLDLDGKLVIDFTEVAGMAFIFE